MMNTKKDPSSIMELNINAQNQSSATQRTFWIELDDFHFRMECAIKMVDAVHEAMENGDSAAECYNDALCGASEYLMVLTKELGSIVTDMRDAV